MLTAEIRDLFSPSPAGGKTLLITVGNPLRSDDGVGPFVAKTVPDPQEHLLILNAGENPENIIDDAIASKPAKIVILDAADFQGVPGEARVIPVDAIPDNPLSTHTFPLTVIAKILAEDTRAPVFFLGIQMKSRDFGEALSREVSDTAGEIIRLISGKEGT